MQLDIDATEEDIKLRYRKLSTLVHPDKCLNFPTAREAFEEVHKKISLVIVVSSVSCCDASVMVFFHIVYVPNIFCINPALQVKKAYNTLMEEDRRLTTCMIIENTRKYALKERKQKLKKGR